jgi:hypothetical protein
MSNYSIEEIGGAFDDEINTINMFRRYGIPAYQISVSQEILGSLVEMD